MKIRSMLLIYTFFLGLLNSSFVLSGEIYSRSSPSVSCESIADVIIDFIPKTDLNFSLPAAYEREFVGEIINQEKGDKTPSEIVFNAGTFSLSLSAGKVYKLYLLKHIDRDAYYPSCMEQIINSVNATGLWLGTVTSYTPPHATTDIYISIHQTEKLAVVSFLSSVEKNSDLFSSTYIGSSLFDMEYYGTTGYYPADFDAENNKVTYIDYNPIDIYVNDDGQTGFGYVHCETCSYQYSLKLKKIL